MHICAFQTLLLKLVHPDFLSLQHLTSGKRLVYLQMAINIGLIFVLLMREPCAKTDFQNVQMQIPVEILLG